MSTAVLTPNRPIHTKPRTTGIEDAYLAELRFLNKTTTLTYQLQYFAKRAMDIAIASCALAVFAPLMLVIAVAIKITAPGPVLYKSLRIGRNYKPFGMYKFRTMVVNADQLRDQLRKENGLEGNLFKLKDDPRVFPLGRMLRAYSLDELPQLLNVIRGEMSIVGPRPLPPDESDMFEDPYTLRFQVLPGITGQWQVHGRSSLTFQELSELEMGYTLHWNLINDISLMFKTVPAVLLSRGAC